MILFLNKAISKPLLSITPPFIIIDEDVEDVNKYPCELLILILLQIVFFPLKFNNPPSKMNRYQH